MREGGTIGGREQEEASRGRGQQQSQGGGGGEGGSDRVGLEDGKREKG